MTRRWELGRWFVLRHSGFPFDWLEALGLPDEVLAHAGEVLDAERSLQAAGLRESALAAARAGRAPKIDAAEPAQVAAAQRWEKARAALREAYDRERATLRRRLRQRAEDEQVQEAVFLSSPAMYENVWARYLATPERPDNSDGRRVERQVYTYLQRLCAKNETTSFFGPMGYGRCDEEGVEGLKVEPAGPSRRQTFFAFWAVTELARAIGRERSLRLHLPVRVNPLFRREGKVARCAPLSLEVELTTELSALVAAVEQRKTFAGAAAELKLTPEAAERLALPLLKVTYLVRGIGFTGNDFGTFESLLEALKALPESEAKSRWAERLSQLDALRARFESAPGSERRALLPKLEAAFTELTGQAARRGEGQVYSDRFVFYEEASSPFRVRLGRQLSQRLSEALSGALELSAAFGESVQKRRAAEVDARLAGGPDEQDFLSYAIRVRPSDVGGSRFSPVPPVQLSLPETESAEVSPEACGRSSDGGRYALPDVCLGGPPTGGAGAFEIVLSRVHHHLLLWSWLCAFHPDRPGHEAVAGDFLRREPSARGMVGLAIRRRNKGFYQFPGRTLMYAVTDAFDFDEHALTAMDVKVRRTPSGPALFGPDGERLHLYLPLDDFSSYPPFASLAHPQVLHAPLKSDRPQLPRLSVGGAVYQRRRWTVPTATFEKASGMDLFLALERARVQGGWPRFVFARSPLERKPYLIDTRAPHALELLKHMAKGAEHVTFEEMLPAPDQLWLSDERGRYTCELRMQAHRYGPDGS